MQSTELTATKLFTERAIFIPTNLPHFFELEREISTPERAFYANHWKRLSQENAPLRPVVNGVPISVSEDFYDDFLRQSFPQSDTFTVAEAIGRALVKNQHLPKRLSKYEPVNVYNMAALLVWRH